MASCRKSPRARLPPQRGMPAGAAFFSFLHDIGKVIGRQSRTRELSSNEFRSTGSCNVKKVAAANSPVLPITICCTYRRSVAGAPWLCEARGAWLAIKERKNENPDNRSSSCAAGSLLDSINRPDGSARRQVSPRYCWLRLHQLKRERPDPEPALGVGFRGDRRVLPACARPTAGICCSLPPSSPCPPHHDCGEHKPSTLRPCLGAPRPLSRTARARCALGACLRSCRRPGSPLATAAPSASARAACS